jgi:peptidoglycan/LPS O-acetylase OafA/YrhL
MRSHLDRVRRGFPALLGGISLVSVVVLLVWDASPALFPARAHRILGALPLALIGLAYLVYQSIRRPGPMEAFKALLLALAFLFWAANQYWPDAACAPLLNDLAIALFVSVD